MDLKLKVGVHIVIQRIDREPIKSGHLSGTPLIPENDSTRRPVAPQGWVWSAPKIQFMVVAFISLGFLLSGCRSWFPKTEQTKLNRRDFAPVRMPIDSVAMEVAVAEFDQTTFESLISEIEPYLDRQKFSVSDQQRWDQNGIKVAVITGALPSRLRDELESRPMTSEELEELNLRPVDPQQSLPTVSPVISHRRMQFHHGDPKPVPLSDVNPAQAWTVRAGDRALDFADIDVQAWLKVTTSEGKGDGIQVALVPRMTYGPLRKNVGVWRDSLAFRETQTETDYDDLTAHVSLRPGDLIFVYPHAATGELGQAMLAAHPQDPSRRRVLILRLIQTQRDDLFDARLSGRN